MCATGFESPSIPPSSAVNIPAVGNPVPSVDALVADVGARSPSVTFPSGVVAALNAAVDRLSSEVETRDHIIRELRDDNQGLRDQAFQANTWRTQYNNLCKTTADEATAYQNALARANAGISSLNSQLAAARRREVDVARAANQPLQDDLRRVNALLVTHAEEHQRDVARIRDLETSASVAEAARVSAQADRDSAQASVLPIASRAASFSVRVGRCSSFRYSTAGSDTDACASPDCPCAGLENALALSQQASRAEVARLEGLIDQSDLAYTERTMTWRRLLREARAGRESARLVRDALVTRLSDMVTAVGGSLDITQLVRSLESRVEASTYTATPLPPDL
ncbi:hypothetical protein PHMEG_00034683, partial [Phytophthora megakarya]